MSNEESTISEAPTIVTTVEFRDVFEDRRTLGDLAREVLDVQDASNLSGVVHSWSKAIRRLREVLEGDGSYSTGRLNTHPISVLWADKAAMLTGASGLGLADCAEAYTAVTAWANER